MVLHDVGQLRPAQLRAAAAACDRAERHDLPVQLVEEPLQLAGSAHLVQALVAADVAVFIMRS